MDRLAKEGAWLVNSFCCTPVCSPTRGSLMTSRYSTELGIDDWINPNSEPELGLDAKFVTWPQLLSNAGYRTGLVGKWHLGTADRFHPTTRGFDYFMGFRSGGNRASNPTLEKDGETKMFEGLTADILTDHALEFVRKDHENPFLLCLHYRAPHSPWLPVRDEDMAPYQDLDIEIPNPDFPDLNVKRIKQMTRDYYASVSSVDRNLGRVLALLEELKISENTVVVFTSDHGYHLGHHGLWYKGNAQWQLTKLPEQKWPHIKPKQRPNLYDQALRVPTFVRWPQTIAPGSVIDQTVSTLDWFPTLLSMAGVELPDATIRGTDITPLLRGDTVEWDNDLFAEYSMKHGAQTQMRAWRTTEWKLLIDYLNTGRAELYDLKNDPLEKKNLIDSDEPRVVEIKNELKKRIEKQMRVNHDPALGDGR